MNQRLQYFNTKNRIKLYGSQKFLLSLPLELQLCNNNVTVYYSYS
jgi:hypothetical protein